MTDNQGGLCILRILGRDNNYFYYKNLADPHPPTTYLPTYLI